MNTNSAINPTILNQLGQKDVLRSDIRCHLLMEPELRRLCKRLQITDQEIDELLKDANQQPQPQKNKRFRLRRKAEDPVPFIIRRIVRTHLNLLLAKSRLDNLREQYNVELSEQYEIKNLTQDRPDLLAPQYLPPTQAIATLEKLLEQVEAELLKIVEAQRQLREQTKDWIDILEKHLNDFLENTSNENNVKLIDATTKEMQMKVLRTISGITPESMLAPLPTDKNSPKSAIIARLKRLIR